MSARRDFELANGIRFDWPTEVGSVLPLEWVRLAEYDANDIVSGVRYYVGEGYEADWGVEPPEYLQEAIIEQIEEAIFEEFGVSEQVAEYYRFFGEPWAQPLLRLLSLKDAGHFELQKEYSAAIDDAYRGMTIARRRTADEALSKVYSDDLTLILITLIDTMKLDRERAEGFSQIFVDAVLESQSQA